MIWIKDRPYEVRTTWALLEQAITERLEFGNERVNFISSWENYYPFSHRVELAKNSIYHSFCKELAKLWKISAILGQWNDREKPRTEYDFKTLWGIDYNDFDPLSRDYEDFMGHGTKFWDVEWLLKVYDLINNHFSYLAPSVSYEDGWNYYRKPRFFNRCYLGDSISGRATTTDLNKVTHKFNITFVQGKNGDKDIYEAIDFWDYFKDLDWHIDVTKVYFELFLEKSNYDIDLLKERFTYFDPEDPEESEEE